MKKLLLLLLIGLLAFGGCYDCMTFANRFREKQYHFILEKKEKQQVRYSAFIGRNLEGGQDTLREVAFTEMYDAAKAGDTIIKEIGSTDVRLCTKDTCIVYHYYCDGRIVE